VKSNVTPSVPQATALEKSLKVNVPLPTVAPLTVIVKLEKTGFVEGRPKLMSFKVVTSMVATALAVALPPKTEAAADHSISKVP
jgi:hypothetical protein